MQRRDFLTVSGAAAGTAALGAPAISTAAPSKKKPVKMYVGCQRSPTTPEMLQNFKRHGVDHICGYPVIEDKSRGYYTAEEVAKTRELCEKHGVTLDMVALPFLASSHIDREKRPAIMLGKDPERKKDIDDIHKMIEACSKAGVLAFKYNMSILGVVRTERTPGRGGTTLSTWRLKEAKADPPLTQAGRVTDDMAWERITYFLDNVIPVATEFKVRAACHPHDPGMPPEGFQGVVRVLGRPEGLKKFISLHEKSPYHGLNLCLGTTAEMLQDPGKEIHDVIRYFGTRNRIFNIHFRNIRGKRDDFQEVFPDEGSMNMVEVAKTLWEVGYDKMLMPDHMPQHKDDRGGHQAFAYGYGYIKGVLQSLETLVA